MIVIYFYGLVGFMMMRGIFQGNLHFCDSLLQCTASMFREGLVYRTMVRLRRTLLLCTFRTFFSAHRLPCESISRISRPATLRLRSVRYETHL